MTRGTAVTDGLADEPPLVVERIEVDGRPQVVVRGELDAFTAPDLRAGVDAAAGDEVELDLSGVTFIDSSGLACVLASHQRLASEQRRLVIIRRSEVVQRLLELSGVASRLHLDRAP